MKSTILAVFLGALALASGYSVQGRSTIEENGHGPFLQTIEVRPGYDSSSWSPTSTGTVQYQLTGNSGQDSHLALQNSRDASVQYVPRSHTHNTLEYRQPQTTREFYIEGQPQITREVVVQRQPQITREFRIQPQITREVRIEPQITREVRIEPQITREVRIEPQITREVRVHQVPQLEQTVVYQSGPVN